MGEDSKEKEAVENTGRIVFCDDHKRKITNDIWDKHLRSMYIKVSSNLFAVYMDGKGYTSDKIVDLIESGENMCPSCYWDGLEDCTLYFLESVLGIDTTRGPKNGDQNKGIITKIH